MGLRVGERTGRGTGKDIGRRGGDVVRLRRRGAGCRSRRHAAQGLTNVDSTFEPSLGQAGKVVLQLDGAREIDLWLELACNDLFGSLRSGVLAQAHIATCNVPLRDLYYDAWVLADLLKCLERSSARFKRVLVCLSEALNGLTCYTADAVAACRQALAVELLKQGGDPTLSVVGIGHAHIDLAWLWPIRETRRKGGRTFATALDLLARYPDYHFGASQPQLFQWVKEDYPQLYARVQRQVREGRFEIQGICGLRPIPTSPPANHWCGNSFTDGNSFCANLAALRRCCGCRTSSVTTPTCHRLCRSLVLTTL
ncbi:hypothetical protein CEW81_23000 [Kluyvera genomosp. 3]|uniref:Glycoside hydrolase family 38 N-terminal domain-containing protein n=1 Tax=Kluyvera genomosp. 3 TaxID=2774055 RepID=A0A248KL88_9ENTR|nr:hypothetical protein CEW81_23000 [Kluyvera genomosp. 3]